MVGDSLAPALKAAPCQGVGTVNRKRQWRLLALLCGCRAGVPMADLGASGSLAQTG